MTDLNSFEALMAEIEGKPNEAASSSAREEAASSFDATDSEEPIAATESAKCAEDPEDYKKDPRTVRTAVAGVLGFMHADLGRDTPADGRDWRAAYKSAAQTLADAIGWKQQPENRES